ncbi:MAG TPA: hypothetical protein VFF31_34840 [Blastocatellia bacterium]|jgi:hypothetical protein|nr:hypothetical protein [Blastocatellia bacterium]
MKMTARSSLLCAVVAFTTLGVFTVKADQPTQKTVRASFDITVPASDPVYDSAGIPAVADDTPLYANASGLCDHLFPLIAPDEHHITLREWTKAKGNALIKCGKRGTHVVLQVSGLIPNGVYTVWVGTFQAPGLTPDFANLIGLGSLGAPDGSENVILASSQGTAQLSVFHPAGDFSMFGSSECLSEEFEVLLWLPLHLDGQTHGGVPGDECQLGFQGGFRFRQ